MHKALRKKKNTPEMQFSKIEFEAGFKAKSNFTLFTQDSCFFAIFLPFASFLVQHTAHCLRGSLFTGLDGYVAWKMPSCQSQRVQSRIRSSRTTSFIRIRIFFDTFFNNFQTKFQNFYSLCWVLLFVKYISIPQRLI